MKDLIPVERIAQKIYEIRRHKVMLDRDLALVYGVGTSQLTRQVRRNISRFPENYAFQLSKQEFNNLICQFGTSRWGGTRKPPYVFTEHGVVMLSSVLKSKRAVQMSIIIVEAFVKLRRLVEIGKETASKIREHDIKLLLHDRKINEHTKNINLVISHLAASAKTKKKNKNYGFKQ